MDLFLAISQGIGVSLATGMRTFLAPLAVGALANANLGIDFDGTSYEFLESTPFLGAMLLLVAASTLYERPPRKLPHLPLAVAAGVLGALLFAGSLEADGYSATVGVPAGALCAVLAFFAVRTFIGGAADRLAAGGEAANSSLLTLFADAAALITCVAAVLLPPLSLLPLAFCIWVLISRRRRGGKKYEGLRILR